MTFVQLKYRRKMGLTGSGSLPMIPSDLIDHHANDLLISVRKADGRRADQTCKKVSAITRINIGKATNVVFVGIHSDSPLAPLWVWDAAHAIPVGGTISFEEDPVDCYQLDRAYFKQSFRRIHHDSFRTTYIKESTLAAEDGDLDKWTFGIPVGPEDATLLNACVKRILELPIPQKEIILCGHPADNFMYWDSVRIVGEDITAPPVQICRKKNRIAEEAQYENLCIIHDRVFLPKNFFDAVRRFGNAFPLSGFQSLYFDDRWNFAPRRYSDFGVSMRLSTQTSTGLSRSEHLVATKFSPTVFPQLEGTGFLFANPHRLSKNTYPTGSLYLVKRSVWKMCPQDENLHWIEFEDVEQGERAAEMGIPTRVNPYAITQSMISRPILSVLGATHLESLSGGNALYRSLMTAFPAPRKPLVKKTERQSIIDMNRFIQNWVPKGDVSGVPSIAVNARSRLRVIANALSASQIPLRRDAAERFISDFEKLVLGDQTPYGWRQTMLNHFSRNGRSALEGFLQNSFDLLNQMAQRSGRNVFAKSLHDYLPKRGIMTAIGSLASAVQLAFQNHRTVVFPDGILTNAKRIYDSTPFADYANAETAK